MRLMAKKSLLLQFVMGRNNILTGLFLVLSKVCTILEIIHIILNALHLRNWRGHHQSLLFEVLELFLGNSILVECFVESFFAG